MSPLTNDTALIEALDKVSSIPFEERPALINALLGYAWAKTEEGADFLRMVENADQLQLFDDMLQYLGNSGAAVCRADLVDWMIQRAKIVGAGQAVSNVDSYIQHDSFDAFQMMLLSTPHIEEEADLGGGIRLIPIEKMPSERLLRSIEIDQLYSMLPIPRAKGALFRKLRHKKVHKSQDDNSHFPYKPAGLEALDDARLCLTLARKKVCAVQAIGVAIVPANEVPMLAGCSWQTPQERNPLPQAPIIGIEASKAKQLHEDFLKLDAEDQAYLRIPMRKLNYCASADPDPVEAAIDLRTAMESLFLSDGGSNELRSRLGSRAAIAAGGDLTQRKDAASTIRNVYDWCSKAVHTGRIHEDYDQRQIYSVRSLVRDVICRSIQKGIGKPDWPTDKLLADWMQVEPR